MLKAIKEMILGVALIAAFVTHSHAEDPRGLSKSIREGFGTYGSGKPHFVERFGRSPKFILSFTQDAGKGQGGKRTPGKVECWELNVQTFKDITDRTKTSKNEVQVLSVKILSRLPLLPEEIPAELKEKYPTDPRTLQAGIDGLYDSYWKRMAEQLNTLSQEELDRLILRPGWEFTKYFDWKVSSKNNPDKPYPELREAYAKYWRHFHDILTEPLKKEGKSLLWDWCAASGQFADNQKQIDDWQKSYPGDAYVDICGVDGYATGPRGDMSPSPDGTKPGKDFGKGFDFWRKNVLDPLAAFAKAHGKLVAIDETSTWVNIKKAKRVDPNEETHDLGSGDYVGWWEGIADWMQDMVDQKMLSHVLLFDTDTDSTFHAIIARKKVLPGRENSIYNFPNSAKRVIELFGGEEKNNLTSK